MQKVAVGCLNWYALRVRPEPFRPSGRVENQIVRSLQASGIEHYYPTYSERSGRRDVHTIKSLFPGYLFARFDPQSEQRWAAVSIAGVAGIVSMGLVPAAIPDEQIEAVRRLLASPFSATPHPLRLNRGDRVEITCGPLNGQIGSVIEYKGKQAVIVLLIEGICQAIKTHVLREHIRPLPRSRRLLSA